VYEITFFDHHYVVYPAPYVAAHNYRMEGRMSTVVCREGQPKPNLVQISRKGHTVYFKAETTGARTKLRQRRQTGHG